MMEDEGKGSVPGEGGREGREVVFWRVREELVTTLPLLAFGSRERKSTIIYALSSEIVVCVCE